MSEDVDHAWIEISAALRDAVGERTYGLWLAPLRCEGLSGDTLVVTGPREVVAWTSDRLSGVLQSSAAAVLGPQITVSLLVPDDEPRSEDLAASPASACDPDLASALHPKYTFEQFVIGPSNRLAHAAALSVAELPAQAYNPLFIYGPPGLGKTHLLHSIANYVHAFGGGLRVRYTTAEAYTNDFVAALGSRSLDAFKARFRQADVLLFDDVQFLERKTRTEEEFFHTFNALYETGSQLILTSDRLPADLDGLQERLRERFAAGLVTDIGRPDYTTRLAILRKRAAHDRLDLPDEAALEVIAEIVDTNVRALEGSLIRVVAYASLTGTPVTTDTATEVLGRLAGLRKRPGAPSIAEIQRATCSHFALTPVELVSRSRTERLAWPRQVAMYLARELTDHSLPVIAREFGGRDHTTVLHAWRRATARISTAPDAYAAVEQITASLTNG